MRNPNLDPEVRTFLAAFEAAGGPPLESLSPAEARQAVLDAMAAVQGELEPVARIEAFEIPGPGGPVPVRVYTPEGEGPHPCLVYFHGGGWVVCDLDTHAVPCSAIAHRAGAVVVAVDYSLSPEVKFPTAVDECYAATRWVAANAERLYIDPRRIATGGDSAGGNLAAVVSLKARDEGGPELALQVLVYPVTNLASFDTDSYREFADDYYLTRSEMVWFRDHYLAKLEDRLNPYASPLLANDLRGLPPALVITAECDPLRDEGEAYAKRLREAGVEATYACYAGMIHPFFALAGVVRRASDAYDQVAAAVRGMGAQRSMSGQ